MPNRRSLPMHHSIIDDDLAAESMPNALMPQTDAENRNLAAKPSNHLVGQPTLPRRAWPRRNQNPFRLQLLDAIERDFVIAMHLHRDVHLPQVLHQVVSERVVVVQ